MPDEELTGRMRAEPVAPGVGMPLQLGERKILLLALDILMLCAAAGTTIALWSSRLGVSFTSQLNLFNMKWMGLMAILWLVLTKSL